MVASGARDSAKPPTRRNPAQVRENILEVATAEFAENGLAAASVNTIAAKTATTKRMIYYYFTNKEGLYTAVLERSYRMMAERLAADLHREGADAVDELRSLAERTFDFHDTHRDYVRLVVGENMLRGAFLAGSEAIRSKWAPLLDIVEEILQRGREQGVVRAGVTAVDVQMLINSFSLFRIANRYTFDALYGSALASPEERDRLRRMIGDLVVRTVAP